VPISCSQTSITGQDGLVMFSPAGTTWCLKDHSDFPAGVDITVPPDADYKVGDPVVFTVEAGGKVDTALTAGTTYYIVALSPGKVQVSATKGGTAITLNGDGGSAGSGVASITATTPGVGYTPGTYNNVSIKQGANVTAKATVVVPAGGALAATAITVTTPGVGYTAIAGSLSLTGGTAAVGGAAIDAVAPTTAFAGTATLTAGSDSAGHVNIAYKPVDALCGVKEWSLDLSRESIDTTTLPCKTGGAASRYASFRTSQAGFASGEGSMTVVFTSGQGSLTNRLLANSMARNSVADVKLYINAVNGTGGALDDTSSNYIEAKVSLSGLSVSVNTDDIVEAEVKFSLAAQPTALFGVKLD